MLKIFNNFFHNIYFYYKSNKNTKSLKKFPPFIGILCKNIEFLKMIISPLKRADSFLVEICVCVYVCVCVFSVLLTARPPRGQVSMI